MTKTLTLRDRIIKDLDISYGKVIIGGIKMSESAYYISLKGFILSAIKQSYDAGHAQGQLDEVKSLLDKSKDIISQIK